MKIKCLPFNVDATVDWFELLTQLDVLYHPIRAPKLGIYKADERSYVRRAKQNPAKTPTAKH